jgi:hypothetical protein
MLMLYPVREGEARMMGRQNDAQEKLLYSCQLEDHIPKNHLLRGIHRFLDLSDLHQHLAEFYAKIRASHHNREDRRRARYPA